MSSLNQNVIRHKIGLLYAVAPENRLGNIKTDAYNFHGTRPSKASQRRL